jgi:hypothetical protein
LIENAKVFFLFRVFSARYWELKQYSIVVKTKPSTDDVYGKKWKKLWVCLKIGYIPNEIAI